MIHPSEVFCSTSYFIMIITERNRSNCYVYKKIYIKHISIKIKHRFFIRPSGSLTLCLRGMRDVGNTNQCVLASWLILESTPILIPGCWESRELIPRWSRADYAV